jgi:hypothetical protein
MGSIAPIVLKFGDKLALVCDLPLASRNLLFSFRQAPSKSRPIHTPGPHQRDRAMSRF